MDTDKILEIDRQSYIQKNKIMARWAERYQVCFGNKTVDDLSFADLLRAVEQQDREEVYAELHRLLNHGVTPSQKAFLYDEYSQIAFIDTAYDDFDEMLSTVGEKFRENGADNVVLHLEHELKSSFMTGCYIYSAFPLPMIEYLFETSEIRTEAILLQNGYILIIRALSSLENDPWFRGIKVQVDAIRDSEDDDDDD